MHSICLFFCSITRIDKTLQITRCFDTEAVIIWLVLSTCFLSVIFKDIIYIYGLLLWYDCKDKMYIYLSIHLYFIQIQLHIIFSWVLICKIFWFSYVNLKQKIRGSSNYFHSQSGSAWMVRFFARIFALYYHVNIRWWVIWYINDLFLIYKFTNMTY